MSAARSQRRRRSGPLGCDRQREQGGGRGSLAYGGATASAAGRRRVPGPRSPDRASPIATGSLSTSVATRRSVPGSGSVRPVAPVGDRTRSRPRGRRPRRGRGRRPLVDPAAGREQVAGVHQGLVGLPASATSRRSARCRRSRPCCPAGRAEAVAQGGRVRRRTSSPRSSPGAGLRPAVGVPSTTACRAHWCTPPMWSTRPATVHPGQDGTTATGSTSPRVRAKSSVAVASSAFQSWVTLRLCSGSGSAPRRRRPGCRSPAGRRRPGRSRPREISASPMSVVSTLVSGSPLPPLSSHHSHAGDAHVAVLAVAVRRELRPLEVADRPPRWP